MIFLKLIFGIFFLFLGLIYLYKPNLVLAINRIARDIFFNDKTVLLERKKLAILLFCVAFISLYMGLTSLASFFENQNKKIWFIEPIKYSMYIATQDYYAGRYKSAIERYIKILPLSDDQQNVLKCMAFTYMEMGEKDKAKALFDKLLQLDPDDQVVKIKLQKLKANNENKSN
ncbi:MAG: tetratricopeptide repeat protein [Elusimicrobia bacterium]|nr:tetratricopeptide repeat protein [Candidatus Liberimonas magnetica]